MTAAAALANGLRSEGVVIPLVDLESMFPVDVRSKSWLPARLRSFIAAATIDGATSATCKCMKGWIRASEPPPARACGGASEENERGKPETWP